MSSRKEQQVTVLGSSKSPDIEKEKTSLPVLRAENVKTYFTIPGAAKGHNVVRAVDGVSLTVQPQEIVGIVGESGCGKSTLGKTLLRLEALHEGKVYFHGRDIFSLNHKELKQLRTRMQLVFQDPFSALNPRKKIHSILSQGLRIHRMGSRREIADRVTQLMEEIGLNPQHQNRFPHQFSGGQRQRLVIARALTLNPEFIVFDEVLSALDLSVQAQMLNLLLEIQSVHKFASIFISHDLSVVEFISDRVVVMYLGRIVESAPTEELISNHAHPYSRSLFDAFPQPTPVNREKRKRKPLEGDIPSPINPPTGCYFHTRCPFAMEKCKHSYPELKEIAPKHYSACFLHGE